jgi:hypothetical protein
MLVGVCWVAWESVGMMAMTVKCAIPLQHGVVMFEFGGISDGNDVWE